jgi:hypothetical protein
VLGAVADQRGRGEVFSRLEPLLIEELAELLLEGGSALTMRHVFSFLDVVSVLPE